MVIRPSAQDARQRHEAMLRLAECERSSAVRHQASGCAYSDFSDCDVGGSSPKLDGLDRHTAALGVVIKTKVLAVSLFDESGVQLEGGYRFMEMSSDKSGSLAVTTRVRVAPIKRTDYTI